jgi:hypothetical protein
MEWQTELEVMLAHSGGVTGGRRIPAPSKSVRTRRKGSTASARLAPTSLQRSEPALRLPSLPAFQLPRLSATRAWESRI